MCAFQAATSCAFAASETAGAGGGSALCVGASATAADASARGATAKAANQTDDGRLFSVGIDKKRAAKRDTQTARPALIVTHRTRFGSLGIFDLHGPINDPAASRSVLWTRRCVKCFVRALTHHLCASRGRFCWLPGRLSARAVSTPTASNPNARRADRRRLPFPDASRRASPQLVREVRLRGYGFRGDRFANRTIRRAHTG